MDKHTISLLKKASLSINSAIFAKRFNRRAQAGQNERNSISSEVTPRESFLRPRSASKAIPHAEEHHEWSHLRVESPDPDLACEKVSRILRLGESANKIGGKFLSVRASLDTARRIAEEVAEVDYLDIKKRSRLHLTEVLSNIGLVPDQKAGRQVPEDGTGVLIGIVDSGFDLRHLTFWDKGKQRLRVEGLWDQKTKGQPKYNTAELEEELANGRLPGVDLHGHGTHVASIAGGSAYRGFEGIAPGARFLLVRSNMVENEDAAAWILEAAKGRPVVMNLSYGHHYGAHDGTDGEERFHADHVAGPGRIIVASAGNERKRGIHAGIDCDRSVELNTKFDIRRTGARMLKVYMNAWYEKDSLFQAQLVSPLGEKYPMPDRNQQPTAFEGGNRIIELYHQDYRWSAAVQMQIAIELDSEVLPDSALEGWRLEFRCVGSRQGRLDVWIGDEETAKFTDSNVELDGTRTMGIPATGRGAIAVGAHVSRTQWQSDDGPQMDASAKSGEPCGFSSLGPTRDGRRKPEISCPGQYITAAMAESSALANWSGRSRREERLLTLEGTSMSAPVLTGTLALMLQRNPSLRPDDVRKILKQTAKRDDMMNGAEWHAALGYGKLDALKAILAAI